MSADKASAIVEGLQFLSKPLRWLFERAFPKVANPIYFVVEPAQTLWDQAGSKGERGQHAYVNSVFCVTNAGRKPVRFISHSCKQPKELEPRINILASGVYAPDESRMEAFEFFRRNRDWKDEDSLQLRIEVIDNFNRRWKFSCDCPPRCQGPKPVQKAVEDESLLEHADEKALVAILKDELQQYARNGRQQGGLGSVKSYDDVSLRSSNVTKAADLIRNSPDGTDRLEEALRSRMSGIGEYAEITYFFLAVLHNLSWLAIFFKWVNEAKWAEDNHALSDACILLSQIIKIDGEHFSEDDLAFIEGDLPVLADPDDPAMIEWVRKEIRAERVRRLK